MGTSKQKPTNLELKLKHIISSFTLPKPFILVLVSLVIGLFISVGRFRSNLLLHECKITNYARKYNLLFITLKISDTFLYRQC